MAHARYSERLDHHIAIRILEGFMVSPLHRILDGRGGRYAMHVRPLQHFLLLIDRIYSGIGGAVPYRNLREWPRVV